MHHFFLGRIAVFIYLIYFVIADVFCYCLTNLIILRHFLLRRIKLVCYYFYLFCQTYLSENVKKKYLVRREIFFLFYGMCVFPSLCFEEKNYKSFVYLVCYLCVIMYIISAKIYKLSFYNDLG